MTMPATPPCVPGVGRLLSRGLRCPWSVLLRCGVLQGKGGAEMLSPHGAWGGLGCRPESSSGPQTALSPSYGAGREGPWVQG